VGPDQAPKGRHRRAARSAVHEARPRDHGRRARGRGDPDANFTLAAAVQKRATTRCPRTTSSGRSIAARAHGGADAIERVVYEGYGPGGAAILVEALTDNRNRTSADMRHTFDKHGGSLGEPGSVAWVFEKRGVVLVDAGRYSEDDLIAAIDAGADDVSADGDSLKVVCAAEDLTAVREASSRPESRSSRPS
jgi:transcriptional/translational regulatory protein YebC/TACO1